MIGIQRVIVLLAVVAIAASLRHRKPVSPYKCEPGSRIKVDCNYCICSPDGNAGACTRMACNLGENECIPGTYFQLNRDLCYCPSNGYKWDSSCFG